MDNFSEDTALKLLRIFLEQEGEIALHVRHEEWVLEIEGRMVLTTEQAMDVRRLMLRI